MRCVLLCALTACEVVFPLDNVSLPPEDAPPPPTTCWNEAATGDYDGDDLIDGCDPCPAFADARPVADEDRDLVGDACDPASAIGGDRIVAFDGFETHLPWEEMGGTWIFAAGSYQQSDVLAPTAEVTLAIPPSRRPAIDVQFQLIDNQFKSFGEIFLDVSTGGRVTCRKRFADGADKLELEIAGELAGTMDIGANGESMRLTLLQSRDGGFTCRVRQGPIDVSTSAPSAEVTSARIGIGFSLIAADLQSVTVFTSD